MRNANQKLRNSLALLLVVLIALGELSAAGQDDQAQMGVEVKQQLRAAQELAPESVEVTAEEGIVILSGAVSTLAARDRAAELAKSVPGVRAVVNTLTVRPSAGGAADLKRRVQEALERNEIGESQFMDIVVRGSNINLRGEIATLEQKQLAEQAVKSVPGVRSVNNQLRVRLEPTGREPVTKPRIEKSDAEILEAVRDAYYYDPRVVYTSPEISVTDGVVTLTEAVGGWDAKLAAEETARNTVGVVDVKNFLKVRPFSAYELTGATRDRIEEVLRRDPYVDFREVFVVVLGGTVKLSGVVDSTRERQRVEQLVSQVEGVTNVVNDLLVQTGPREARNPGPQRSWWRNLSYSPDQSQTENDQEEPPQQTGSDQKTAERIRLRIAQNPTLRSRNIRVSVNDDTAYLSGVVRSEREKERAEALAAQGEGIQEVQNELVVRAPSLRQRVYDPQHVPPGQPYRWTYPYPPYPPPQYPYAANSYVQGNDWPYADSDIRREVETQFFQDPFLNAFDVNVDVRAGVVTLTGSVDTWADRRRAELNAYAAGARRVVNRLRVDPG